MIRLGKKGSALILTLWIVIFLTCLIQILEVQILGSRRSTRAFSIRSYETIALETLQARLMTTLKKKDPSKEFDALKDPWAQNPNLFKEVVLDEPGAVKADLVSGKLYGAQDEERFININQANLELLKNLFVQVGLKAEAEALALAAAVQDWRDVDNFPSARGVDTESKAKNSPFESVEELLEVQGMDEATFEKIRPFVTLYGKGPINLNTAPETVLKVLGAPESLVQKILSFRKGSDQAEGSEDDGVFESARTLINQLQAPAGNLETGELNALSRMREQGWVDVKSHYFRLPIQLTAYGKVYRRQAVVDLSGKLLEVRQYERPSETNPAAL